MSLDLSVLILAVCLGAVLQVGVGIGFSILAGPPMMILLGTATAIPALLLLNTIVSVVATDWRILTVERQTITKGVIGCLVGVMLGLSIYPWLSEAFVLALTGILLLIGVVSTLFPVHTKLGPMGFITVSGLSGLATVWAATPGPLMVFGLIAKGYTAREVAILVQPIALVAYGTAFLLHSLSNWSSIPLGAQLWYLATIAAVGGVLGRTLRSYLPQAIAKSAIRAISLVACYVLLQRAYAVA
ncbi:Sulfite exporter TauE/SafE [Ruegeria halocynthiae]|uniref:Probable membrane transporter protein n=1 Tax=Ruegeria halocynthiae TaxID=985054 RepID=A0A1H3E2E4_9RHOB|nr:TSUP family transporter [Ruegeria halocynthiae]SDX72807.1 Sulfite exporter TauE/SafE [Ruegeria halocynthiae]